MEFMKKLCDIEVPTTSNYEAIDYERLGVLSVGVASSSNKDDEVSSNESQPCAANSFQIINQNKTPITPNFSGKRKRREPLPTPSLDTMVSSNQRFHS